MECYTDSESDHEPGLEVHLKELDSVSKSTLKLTLSSNFNSLAKSTLEPKGAFDLVPVIECEIEPEAAFGPVPPETAIDLMKLLSELVSSLTNMSLSIQLFIMTLPAEYDPFKSC